MRTSRSVWVSILVATALAPCGSAGAAEYVLDPTHSTLVVRVFRGGAAAQLAHDHVIRATRFSGTFQGDLTYPSGATASLDIATAALQADEPELRRKYNLKPLSAEDQQAITTTMLGKSQLDAAQYPTIEFRLSSAVAVDPGHWDIGGDLRLHGRVQPLHFRVTVQMASSDTVRISGRVTIQQSAFGIHPYRMFFGAVRNQDAVDIIFDLVGTRHSG